MLYSYLKNLIYFSQKPIPIVIMSQPHNVIKDLITNQLDVLNAQHRIHLPLKHVIQHRSTFSDHTALGKQSTVNFQR